MFEEDKENNLKTLQKIIITDNGIGLNVASFTRLLNLRDNSKSKNNKGTGRIQYLHYFDDTFFESVYKPQDMLDFIKEGSIFTGKCYLT